MAYAPKIKLGGLIMKRINMVLTDYSVALLETHEKKVGPRSMTHMINDAIVSHYGKSLDVYIHRPSHQEEMIEAEALLRAIDAIKTENPKLWAYLRPQVLKHLREGVDA
jgi:hypothetical protein